MWIRGIKLTIGAVVGVLIAHFLGLANPLTAGTIVLLSLGKTRRSSLAAAIVRIKALILTLALATVIFLLFDFSIYAFAIFLSAYIFLVLKLKLDEGLIIGAVTAGQILAKEAVNPQILGNAIGLFAIGVFIAFLLNIYMPDLSQNINDDKRYIETTFCDILLIIATILRGDPNFDAAVFDEMEVFINKAIMQTKTNEDNYFFLDVSYQGKYIRMRKRQFYILKHMFELANQIDMTLVVGEGVAQLVEKMAFVISESGTGEAMLKELSDFSRSCQQGALPQSRGEFENRAILFQILSEMRHLTELKREFANEYG